MDGAVVIIAGFWFFIIVKRKKKQKNKYVKDFRQIKEKQVIILSKRDE